MGEGDTITTTGTRRGSMADLHIKIVPAMNNDGNGFYTASRGCFLGHRKDPNREIIRLNPLTDRMIKKTR